MKRYNLFELKCYPTQICTDKKMNYRTVELKFETKESTNASDLRVKNRRTRAVEGLSPSGAYSWLKT